MAFLREVDDRERSDWKRNGRSYKSINEHFKYLSFTHSILLSVSSSMGKYRKNIDFRNILSNRVISSLFILIAILLSLIAVSEVAAAETISVDSITIASGGTATVAIQVTDITTDIAAGTVTLTFNPAVVTVQSVSAGSLGAPTINIKNVAGTVLISVFSTTSATTAPVKIATVTLKGTGVADGATSALTLTVNALSDSNGANRNPGAAGITNGVATIVGPSYTAQLPSTPIPSTGTIAISSTPSGASIYLDGLYKGTTPKVLNDITQGSHDVKLTLSGYNDWSDLSYAAAGGTSYLKADLTTAALTFTPLPTLTEATQEIQTPSATTQPVPPESTQTPQPSIPEVNQINWLLVGGAILAILLVGALVMRKLKGNETKAAEKTKSVAVPAEEPDRKSKAEFIEKSKKPDVKQPKETGAVNVKSAFEYKGAKIYFKIKVENSTLDPISDIKVHLFVPEVFLLSEKEKAISMLETKESKTVTFEIRPTGECGECNVSGKIEYYDYAAKGRKMLDIENKSLSVICPVLKRKEIDPQQWEKVTDELIKAEEKIKELSAPAENLFNITSRVIKDNGMFMLKPEITSTPSLFNGLAMFYAEGVTGYRYAAYMEVVGGARKSRMILKVWAEKEEALIGFYHRILDDIEKRIDVKIFIDDAIVQQHIHYGDKIGTQVKDSVIQRSTIGTGARKCSECGKAVKANATFCPECGTEIGG